MSMQFTGSRPQRQRGLSLVELMVSLTIGLLLLAGVVSLVVGASGSNRNIEQNVQLVENGRFASEQLRNELEHAGFYGGLFPPAAANWPAVPAALPDPCAGITQASLVAALPLAIQGEDNPVGSPANSCLNDADHVDGTDIVFIRRASVVTTAPGAAAGNRFYFQGSAVNFSLDAGANVDAAVGGFGVRQRDGMGNLVATPLRAFHVDAFYISPRTRPAGVPACNADTTDEEIPTLMRLRLTGTSFCAEPIAAGIENLQIEYGIDDDGDGAPDRYEENPGTPAAWADVVSAQLFVLARSAVARGDAQVKNFLLGDGEAGPDGSDNFVPANPRFTRHVFATTARLVNVSGRREAP